MAKREHHPKVLLTVDWDAFVPEDHAWDLGHHETDLFIDRMWGLRGHLADKIKTSGEEQLFWKRVQNFFKLKPMGVTVSDSHVCAYSLLRDYDYDLVINVDAHHDCWKAREDKVDCATWGDAWLAEKKTRRLIWVVPGWQDPDESPQHREQVTVVPLSSFERDWGSIPRVIKTMHICRSGCWTPPWLDEAFIAFVAASGRYPLLHSRDVEGTPWDALRPRWTQADFDAMKARYERVERAKEEMAAMLTKTKEAR